MRFTRSSVASVLTALAALLPGASSLSSTDFPNDGGSDLEQSGYNPNHNFSPAALSTFKLNWTATFNTAEMFYAKPLVFTPRGAPYERIYTVSNQNYVRILDGMTGAVLKSRQLDAPFSSSDTQCGDIPNTIGIIGTPVIDPETEIMYFWSKSYQDGKAGPQGIMNGKWTMYAVRTSDLTDTPGFPFTLNGANAYNDRARYLIAGTLNQRPGLVMMGNTIVSAFGSHCMNFNYTGYLVTTSKTPGVGVTNIQAMSAPPGAPNPQALDIDRSNNGRSGIWQGGNPPVVDLANNRIFFTTANGQSPGQLMGSRGVPTSGKTLLSTMMNAVVSYRVDPATGGLSQQDWFVPTNYDNLNGADRDLGSSGTTLLDPTVFSGGGISRIVMCAGKNGTIYIMDAENLGGFRNGPDEGNNVLQLIWPDNASFFSGVASYPLEGGYIYFVPTSDSIYAYKFGLKDGKPWFTYAGKTAMTFAGRGAPRVTSQNGQPGTGIVWLSDINQGLVAFKAVPENGVLVPIPLPATGRLTKFHRPSFGNQRIYTTQTNKIVAVGSPNGVANPPSSSSSTSSSATTSMSSSTVGSSSSTSVSTSSSSSSSSPSPSTSSSTASTTVSSSVTTTTTATTSVTTTTTSVTTSPSPTTTTTSVQTTTTTTRVTTTTTKTAGPPTSTGDFSHVGCYQDRSSGHALPVLFANDSVTPELCEAYVQSLARKPTPTVYQYFFLEYARECYGGSTFDWQGSSVTSLSATTACSLVCSGSVGATATGTAKCGGRKQFNLYVKGGSQNLPDYWPGVTRTSTTSATTTSSSSPPPPTTTTTTAPSSSSSVTTSSSQSTTTASTFSTSSTFATSSSVSSSQSSSSTTTTTTSKVSTSTSSMPPAYTTPVPPAGKRTSITWDLTWVNAAPDGFNRPLIAVNGQYPNPALVLNYGDILVLTVNNKLGNESTSIHFHGIQQRESNFADGPTFVTQCPIPPGESFVYQFKATQVGTFWYHSHHGGQYIDGLRGPLIINNPAPPYETIDQEHTLTLVDHYHKEAPYLIHEYQSVENGDNGGPEPVPDAALINGAQNVKFTLTPGKTNLFRIINMGAMAGYYLQFDQHTMTIVEVDGVYVAPKTVDQLFIAVAQRYSVIVKSKSDKNTNFAIVATMAPRMFDISNPPANPTVTGHLVYDASKPLPAPFTIAAQPFDDGVLIPLDQETIMGPVTKVMSFTADFGQDPNGLPRSFLNGASHVEQKVPTLYSVLTAPSDVLNNPAIYGTGANPYIIPYNAIVEININNHDDRAHPFHLHGHDFQLIYRSDNGYLFPGLTDPPAMPMKRDTVTVYAQGTATIRFKADNPGVQLFHCHTEWHVVSGMTATFIEAPTELVASKPYIPASHRTVCDNYNILRKGNAAGNSKNWLDLTGANTEAPTNNWGALNNPPS